MTHKDVFKRFKEITHVEDDKIECWFPNGKRSVRVRTKEYGDLIFTYASKKKWKIESVDSWLECNKCEVK